MNNDNTLLFLVQNSVFQIQAGIFLFIYRFEAEIFL